MRKRIIVESAKMHISPKDSDNNIQSDKQNVLSIETGKPQLKMHIALKISRFFELKIEDDFYTD